MIKPETIDKIFESARIEEVVGDFVNLRKRGVNMLGLCPFHNEKTPSFTVSPSKGIYKCFGCGKGGNAVNFIMEHEHFSYPEALKYLAGKYNIEVDEEKPTEEQQQALDEKESLFNLTAFAQKHFEETLHNTEDGKAIGLSYFKERGFTTETIRKFGLGYSLNKWDDFTSKALKNAYSKDLLLKSSLVRQKDEQLYDSFRNRVTFPIHNLSGRVLGFGARILTNEKNKPKYINTAESEIYHKGKVLYGLYFAKSAIIKQDNCCLVEGYTDVISLHQAGIENVIASSGTSLTTDQIRLIRRYSKNITLLFDGDPAGIKAAFRGIDMILEEEMNVRIVLFPEGEDPDSYARNYRPSEVKAFMEENAVDFITFKTNLLLAETQNDPVKKTVLVKEIAHSIAQIPEPVTRELYARKSSDLLDISEKLLMLEINKKRIEKRKSNEKQGKSIQEEQKWIARKDNIADPQVLKELSVFNQEKELIRVLLAYPEEQLSFLIENEEEKEEEVTLSVKNFILDDLVNDDLSFENQTCQTIFDEILTARKEQRKLSDQTFFQHKDPEVSKMVIDMLSTPYELSLKWEDKHGIYVKKESDNVKKIVMDVLYSFKLRKIEKMIHENKEELKKKEIPPEEMFENLKSIKELEDVKIILAKELSRIVIN
ncbi:MAG: DNA primase [Thermotogota bacterium]